MPVYSGTIPPIRVNVNDPGSGSGSAKTGLDPTYNGFPLMGCYAWFELGYYDSYGVWHCSYWTNWCYAVAPSGCFAAGTPLLTPGGSKPIERCKVGDLILSSPEDDAAAPTVACRVKEVIRSRGKLVGIAVGGHVVHATREHPFFVKGKSWTPAASLVVGDLLRSHDGRWVPVESVVDGPESPVYNLRIEKNATYFVGARDWGLSLWVSAACGKAQAPPEDLASSGPFRSNSLSEKGTSRR
jgi:hypothetical protein